MSEPAIEYAVEGAVARLTITQPARLNAITLHMWRSLPGLVGRAEADASARLILVEGSGERAFSAGADISQFGERRSGDEAVRDYEAAVAAAMAALANARKPTLARIRGLAFGGGLALALCCDLRVGPANARFRIPAARLGLGYAFAGVEALAARIGVDAAADLLLTARILEGREAERLGLLTKCWEAEAFEVEAGAYIAGIAANAPLTLAALKRALIECRKVPAERDRVGADALVEACFRSADYAEGQAAFREKREPRFRGA
jgi:enoyl-CoA hydratase/carnithine racemase